MKTLADLYYQVGDFSHALKIHDDVLSQRDLSWAKLGRGKILMANQDYDDAAATLKELVSQHPDYMEAYDLLAEALEKQGRPTQAQQILEKAAERSPTRCYDTSTWPSLLRPIRTCRQRPKPGGRPSALAPTRYTITPNTILHWASHCLISVKGTRQMRGLPMRTKP